MGIVMEYNSIFYLGMITHPVRNCYTDTERMTGAWPQVSVGLIQIGWQNLGVGSIFCCYRHKDDLDPLTIEMFETSLDYYYIITDMQLSC